jgi:hypothetical protein
MTNLALMKTGKAGSVLSETTYYRAIFGSGNRCNGIHQKYGFV